MLGATTTHLRWVKNFIMNIDRLVVAAKEIDRLASYQEHKTHRLMQLAREARNVVAHSREHQKLMQEKDALMDTVVNFSDAIEDLRRALNARPSKKPKE